MLCACQLGSTPWLERVRSMRACPPWTEHFRRWGTGVSTLWQPHVCSIHQLRTREACDVFRKKCTRHVGHASSISRFFLGCRLLSARLLCLAGCGSSHAGCVMFATGHYLLCCMHVGCLLLCVEPSHSVGCFLLVAVLHIAACCLLLLVAYRCSLASCSVSW